MRVALLDADIVAYTSCNLTSSPHYLSGIGTRGNLANARALFEDETSRVREELDADEVVLCFSDPSRRYWRHDVLESYKAGRSPKPPGLFELQEWARREYGARWYPGLEGDDVLGILATGREFAEDETVVVSIDKDLATIPGGLYNPDHPDLGIQEITREQADRFHLYQTLMGDSVDGYKGIPGVGPKTAAKILDADCSWAAVVAAYRDRGGLSESDALIQARVAHILRAGEYSSEFGVRLWEPTEEFCCYV